MNCLANRDAGEVTVGKRSYNGPAAALCALTFFMMQAACTEVDDRLGADLVPKNQRMEIEVTSPGNGVRTFLYRTDSIPSSRTGNAWFGRTVDPTGNFGAQTGSMLLQFLPISLPYANAEGYGLDPIVDSACIIFSVTGTRGDTLQVQRFDVWEVDDSREAVKLHRDSTYYTSFPMERFKGRKLFEFKHTGKRDVWARLFPTAAGKEYLDKIVQLPWDEYTNDSLFNSKFRGLIITPAEGSPPAAALYGADLESSGIQFYVRNHDTLDMSAIYDTVTTAFTFSTTDTSYAVTDDDDESTTYEWANISVGISSFDYAGSTLGMLETQTNGFTDTLPTSTPLQTLYVQSMGGVGAYLRFPDELVDEIRNLRFKIDDSGQAVGKDIAINQAMMRIWLTDNSMKTLDGSIKRMGSYLDPKKLSPIPDYMYEYEVYQNQLLQQQQSTETYELPYGGYLNRSNGYYELDITSYVQQLSRVKEDDPEHLYVRPAFFLGPEAYGILGPGQSILKGFDSDNPISIRITYTIIEG